MSGVSTRPLCSHLYISIYYCQSNSHSLDFGINEAYDILSVEDETRDKLFASLEWDSAKIEALAEACNNLPVIELELGEDGRRGDAKMDDGDAVTYLCSTDTPFTLTVNIKRDLDEGATLPPVICPFYPVEKLEQWWLLIGEKSSNKVISIRRVTLNKSVPHSVHAHRGCEIHRFVCT